MSGVAIVHVLGTKEMDYEGLGSMHILDQDPVEVQDQGLLFDHCGRGG